MDTYIDILDANYLHVSFNKEMWAYDMSDYFTQKLDESQLKHNPKYKYGRWNGEIKFYNVKNGKIYLGLLHKVISYMSKRCLNYELSPKLKKYMEKFSQEDVDLSEYERVFKFRYYQEDTVQECLAMRRVLVKSPTSSGKTFMIYSIAEHLKKKGLKTLIIVPSVSLVTQMGGSRTKMGDFEEYGGNPNDYHLIYSGKEKFSDKNIFISTWQSLRSLLKTNPKFFLQFGCVIADEAHQATADVMIRLVQACKNAYYRFGFSGTYYKSKTDLMTLTGLFGPKYVAITTRQMIDQGFVPDLKIGAIKLKYTIGDCNFIKRQDYNTEMQFIESHYHRNKAVIDICMKLKGNTLCLFRKHEHGKMLKTIADSHNRGKKVYMLTGDDSDEVRKKVINIMERETNILVLATYGIFSTGISIKNLHNVVLGSDMLSYNKVAQSIGRALRNLAGKNSVRIFDMIDDLRAIYSLTGRKFKTAYSNYAYQHGLERLNLYKIEEFDVFFKTIQLEYSYQDGVDNDITSN